MTGPTLRRLRVAFIATGQVALFTTALLAQSSSPPPIPGSTGSIVPDGKGDGATTAIGAGAGKVVEGAKKVLRPGSKEDKQETDPLKALELGTKVVVREGDAAARAAQSVTSTRFDDKEGSVIEIDRRARTVVVRLAADRTTERLRLDESRSDDKTQDARDSQQTGDKVTLSYTDANGTRTTTAFRKIE
jgi:hypothetical protein